MRTRARVPDKMCLGVERVGVPRTQERERENPLLYICTKHTHTPHTQNTRTEQTHVTIHVTTHMHTHTHTHTIQYAYICLHTYIHTCIHTHLHTYILTYTQTCIHTHINTDKHTYINTYIQTYTYTCMHASMHASTRTQDYRHEGNGISNEVGVYTQHLDISCISQRRTQFSKIINSELPERRLFQQIQHFLQTWKYQACQVNGWEDMILQPYLFYV